MATMRTVSAAGDRPWTLLCFALGLAGFAATGASWATGGSEPSLALFAILAICALGGLLPVRLPGLHPLPLSLPVVGSLAVTAGAPEAMAAGFLAGLATSLAPPIEGDEIRWSDAAARRNVQFPVPWLNGWAMGGALALAAGMAASGISHFDLTFSSPRTPAAPAPDQVIKSLGFLTAMMLLAWTMARATRREKTGVRTSLIAVAAGSSAVVSLLSLAVAVARLVWGGAPVLICLAGLGTGAFLMGALQRRPRLAMEAVRRRARMAMGLVEAIALAIEAKDRTSERHLRRVRSYALAVGRRLGMPAEDLEELEYAALLHDIGKLVVPESILSKPAGLSSEEFLVMSAHPRVGAEILQTTPLSSRVAAMVRHHHERYDGSGYPDGLTGMEIPLGARILAAVDTFDAVTSERPYRRGLPVREAVAHLERNAGTLYDPRVVRVLVERHAEFEEALIAEEKAAAAGAGAGKHLPVGAQTRKTGLPYQVVLDRIASSHMEIYSLYEITQALGKSLSLEESFTLIAGKVHRLIHFSACAIYIVNPEEGILRPRFATGTGAARILETTIAMGEKMSGWAAMQRRPASGMVSTDPLEKKSMRSDLEALYGHEEIAALRSSLVAPLLVDEMLIGVIALYDTADHEYTPQEEHLLALLARHAASAVRAGLLFEQTQEHTLTDSLTGLPNPRYMFIAFDQEAARARQQGVPLTLMVMDIDNFREINEDFGHHAGDRFLIGMAKAIRAQLRVCDTCIRYAGDEFVAILPGLPDDEVQAVVERVSEAARDYCMEARPGRAVQLTLSIGYATMPADGGDFETLIKAATARMEDQKRDRREERSASFPFILPTGGRGRHTKGS